MAGRGLFTGSILWAGGGGGGEGAERRGTDHWDVDGGEGGAGEVPPGQAAVKDKLLVQHRGAGMGGMGAGGWDGVGMGLQWGL